MVDLMSPHLYRTGPHSNLSVTDVDLANADTLAKMRTQIEPWLTAVFQSEHLSLLLGTGLTSAVTRLADGTPAAMDAIAFPGEFSADIMAHATRSAGATGRGAPNIEDQIRAATQLRDGLLIQSEQKAKCLTDTLDSVLRELIESVLSCERALVDAQSSAREEAQRALSSFLMSFVSRTSTRERVGIFTTNYDRLLEHGCDLSGLRVIDRFVGALSPVFRASRVDVDIHYNPPGIRGEPRYLEGVVRLTKLHGSLDWRWDARQLVRCSLPFGASVDHPGLPAAPSESVIIYPNPAKDTETLNYPYAELFRDFAAAVCRPNSALVTYGYGFGDDHINRVIADMLTLPSTHLVIIAYGAGGCFPDPGRERVANFCARVGKESQVSLLLGSHFGDLATLVERYLPKPSIDPITARRARLLEQRGQVAPPAPHGTAGELPEEV